jgi:cysteine desulfurase
VDAALRPETCLVSIMHANNEIGTVNDIAAIAAWCARRAGVLLHVDAAQSAGKLPIDVRDLDVDLMSLSAHKFYGPKGVGALYVRRSPRPPLRAQMHGGGHERGYRAGTLATHQIVGMGLAAEIAGAAGGRVPAPAARCATRYGREWRRSTALP